MNQLFAYVAGQDLPTNHAKLLEFWRLDAEIAHLQETMGLKERFHSLEYAVKLARVKTIIDSLAPKRYSGAAGA